MFIVLIKIAKYASDLFYTRRSIDMNIRKKYTATLFAILAAALYAINIPISKLLLKNVGTTMMAGFLYLGAGFGILIYGFVSKILGKGHKKEPIRQMFRC